ncbi:MAG TPA: hypothetical protein VKG43_03780 [Acidimicrobiales bacterium]|nr:hypothetical protein [Acidimicrobiales bacterium]
MTASSADTAELPKVRHRPAGAVHPVSERCAPAGSSSPEAPVHGATVATGPPPEVLPEDVLPEDVPTEDVVTDAPRSVRRCDLTAERRQAARQRRLLAAGGLAVLGGALAATVAVLDTLH